MRQGVRAGCRSPTVGVGRIRRRSHPNSFSSTAVGQDRFAAPGIRRASDSTPEPRGLGASCRGVWTPSSWSALPDETTLMAALLNVTDCFNPAGSAASQFRACTRADFGLKLPGYGVPPGGAEIRLQIALWHVVVH